MDIKPQSQQPISDDQELAKVLAGVNQQADDVAGMQFEESTPPASDAATPTEPPEPVAAAPAADDLALPVMPPLPPASSDLESIKKDALNELRPLVDKLDVSPEEKFDTYLLLIRSTDDQSLVGPAHEAARGITDEARKAQALLDIIKEIDYLSNPQAQQPAA